MKREKFLREVAAMCGPVEREAVHQLAEMPPAGRHDAARQQGRAASDQGLTQFLVALIDDDLIDDLASMLPTAAQPDEAEELLKRLRARLLGMISPEARDVLHAHDRLRLMAEMRANRAAGERAPNLDQGYQSAIETARAVLAATVLEEERG